MSDRQKFSVLTHSQRIWAVGSVHGEIEKLRQIHDALEPRLRQGDRLIYLGNMMGRGPFILRTFNELVAYRSYFLARFQARPEDIVYLRGAQEEMWQKLMQLQFAPNPKDILEWMLSQGVGETLKAYGLSPEEGLHTTRTGAIQLTKWTNTLRRAMKQHPGHYELFGTLKRAAFTGSPNALPKGEQETLQYNPAPPNAGEILFVNCGLDTAKPLNNQKDNFWWAGKAFNRIQSPYGPFKRIVRGFDPDHLGFEQTDHTLTLDGGCGFEDGKLMAACLLPDGQVTEILET
ncbi:hypothetical protein [Kiloniella sp. b19]|uniref:hypothetical protein n=1 Tax=Kiloniella sp. GXU_MW_B19 TaxID=3141326 RepID=UPI0031D99B6A